MSKEIFISIDSHEKRVAVVDGKKLADFYIEGLRSTSIVGNIYKGRVDSVVPGIEAAFIDLGMEKNGFLYVSDAVADSLGYENILNEEAEDESHSPDKDRKLPSINEVLKKGDEVLVQVVKEPIRTKGARLTTHISIPGRFMVLMPFDKHIGISKRISDRVERDRIRKILEEMDLPEDAGFIIRTAASAASKKDIFRETRYLARLWNHIKNKARKARPPHLVHEELDLVLRVVRDTFTTDISKLEIDSKQELKRISKFLSIYSPELRARVRFYRDQAPLFEKFDIERLIDKIYNRFVQLKSGGYLVFDETESLVAIDVNSGKSVREKSLEETAFKTNLEAAEEIPRQLRLRDIGGIIIIDFIDMEWPNHRKSVFKALERNLEDDKAKTKILNISSIGLVEMTRQRMRPSIEGKSREACPYCNGRGTVKSASTIGIELVRKLTHFLIQHRTRVVFVSINPEVASYVMAPERNMIAPIEKRFRRVINIIEDPSRHVEDIKIEEGSA